MRFRNLLEKVQKNNLYLILGEDGEEKKEGEEESPKEKEAGETADETPEVKKAEGPSKATVFLDSLRSVASQVPSLFKGQKDKKAKSEEKDVEAGEKEELLETGEEVKTELLKFIYSEKATKFCEIFTLLLSYVVPAKSRVKISQNFVTFSE